MAAAFLAGLLLADRLTPGQRVSLLAGLAGVASLAAAWLRHRRLPDPGQGDLLPRVGVVTGCLILTGAAAIGFADLGVRTSVRDSSVLGSLDGRVATMAGVVASDPAPAGRGWSFAVRSLELLPDGPGKPQRAAGRVLVRSYGRPPAVELGDRIRIEVKLAGLDPADPFDVRLARRGVVASATLLAPVRVLGGTSNPVLAGSNHFRRRMLEASETALNEDQAALLLGLVIGDERRISDRVQDDFEAAGLSHLTAVSGANVAMVVGGLALLLSALGTPRRLVVASGLVAVVLFTVVTRWEPSVLRAAVMASVALAAFLFGRISSPAHAFALAFLVLVAADPTVLWSAGFQLSFAATAGILWLRPALAGRLNLLPKAVAEAVAIGIAAQVAVFPLIAVHFGRISVAAVPANLAAFALVAPITLLGLAGGVLALVSDGLARVALQPAGLLVSALQWLAKVFGRSSAAQLPVPHFGVLQALAAYLAVAAVWLLLARRGRWARWPALSAGVLLLAGSLAPALGSGPPAGLRVTFFDVGEGDSALVESPSGARILVDGGREPEVIADALRRRGFERIDLVVSSHLHADHASGLPAVLRRFEVTMAIHPGVRVPLLATLAAERPVEAVGDGDGVQVGDLTVEFLGPSADLRELAKTASADPETGEGSALNDASVVMKVNWAGECVLFTGDVEDAGQQDLVDRHPESLDCTVMKAPHHGSGRLTPEFVEAVDPEWVAVSVGPNSYGHPSAKALRLFEGVGARVMRTDRLGDVVISLDAEGRVGSE